MTQEYPSLALSDIMHIMSPSPAPQASADDSHMFRQGTGSPEPLQESEIQQMKDRIAEIGLYENGRITGRPHEKELLDMMMRLTNSIRYDPDQLVRQAEIISSLTEQRNFLVHQAEEQRLRWESEKDGWTRMAEALIAQQNKATSLVPRDEDTERQIAGLEADNKTLRQKFHESQSRLVSLEAELTKLRPFLLVQPTAMDPSPTKTIGSERTKSGRRRRRPLVVEDKDQHVSDDDLDELLDDVDTPTQTQNNTPRHRSRRNDLQSGLHAAISTLKGKSSLKHSRPVYSDARAEHLLLAARKIGKQRAGLMAGLVHPFDTNDREKDRSKDKREDSSTATTSPRTPRRTMASSAHPVGSHMQHGGYIYVNSPLHHSGSATASMPVLVPVPHGSFHLLQTPSSSTTVASSSRQQHVSTAHGQKVAPHTPLDSLLSAARSLMDDEEESIDSAATNGSVRRMRVSSSHEMPDSPLPKRRKFALTSVQRLGGNDHAETTSNSVGVGRVRSALDVLADQAAAFSSNEAQVAKEKGKEKEKTTSLQVDSRGAPETVSDLRTSSRVKERANRRAKVPSSTSRPTPQQELSFSNNWDNTPPNLRPVSQWNESSHASPSVDTGGADPPTNAVQTIRDKELDTEAARASSKGLDVGDPQPTNDSPQVISLGQGVDVTPSPSADDAYLSPVASRAQSEDALHVSEPISPSITPRRAASIPVITSQEQSSADSQTNPPIGRHTLLEQGNMSNRESTEGQGAPSAKNKDLARVAGQTAPVKRQRSPYVKWSKEEDEMLTQAVAKYGQKWDLVQKALPSRGYHQVRQRWLRKLGVFDSKPDLSSFQSGSFVPGSRELGSTESLPNPKLGLAPLSSELVFSTFASRGPSVRQAPRPPVS